MLLVNGARIQSQIRPDQTLLTNYTTYCGKPDNVEMIFCCFIRALVVLVNGISIGLLSSDHYGGLS